MHKGILLIIAVVVLCAGALGVLLGAYGATKGWIPLFEESEVQFTEGEVRGMVIADLVQLGFFEGPDVESYSSWYWGDGIWSGSCVYTYTGGPFGSRRTVYWEFYEKTCITEVLEGPYVPPPEIP